MLTKAIPSFFLCAIISISHLFSQGTQNNQKVDSITPHGLPAIMLDSNYYSPVEGINLSDAKTIIVNAIRKSGRKGDITSNIKITELTTTKSWQNMGVQIYRVILDYAWMDDIFILKDNTVLADLHGMPTDNVYLADLDNDSIYEIYTNYFLGSGIVSEEIAGYNISLNKRYSISMRMEKDLHLFIANGQLMCEVHPWNKPIDAFVVKKVVLKKMNTALELMLE